jgi:para-aminobenzoate synthetase component I
MEQFDTNRFIRENVLKSAPGDCILLESQSRDHPSSVMSIFAANPVRSLIAYGEEITLINKGNETGLTMNPWEALREFRALCDGPIFGFLGYDLKNFCSGKHLVSNNPDQIRTPDMYFMQPGYRVQFSESGVFSTSGELQDLEQSRPVLSQPLHAENLVPVIEIDEYIRNVEEIRNRIREGDFYELNYSYPIGGDFTGAPYELYEQMRIVNPVPFGSFIRIGTLSVCCASPERFLKKEGTAIVSEPIKGTTARLKEPGSDSIQKQILVNEKNRAENLMIVDLVRHDLSRIARPGTVKVSGLFKIQSFGTVHQLISTVEAETETGRDPIDILEACFPMGSMTGAPKIAVMQAIEELEMYRRGIYSGAIGYIDENGNFDFNVVIRSAIIQNGKLVYPVGGAITGDSDPIDEWNETLIKARVLTEVFSANRINTK